MELENYFTVLLKNGKTEKELASLASEQLNNAIKKVKAEEEAKKIKDYSKKIGQDKEILDRLFLDTYDGNDIFDIIIHFLVKENKLSKDKINKETIELARSYFNNVVLDAMLVTTDAKYIKEIKQIKDIFGF